MRYNLNLMRNLIAQRLRMQPELNSRKKAFAHMLYMRLKLKGPRTVLMKDCP